MEKLFIQATACNIGDVLAEDVRTHNGTLVIAKDTVINTFMKNKILNIGVASICIYSNSDELAELTGKEKMIKRYTESIYKVKDILRDLSAGKQLNVDKVLGVSKTIFDSIQQSDHILSCIHEIGSKDQYTYTHSLNTAFYCMLIGKWLGYSKEEIIKVVQCGLLHDIGKLKISDDILNKKGKLTAKEFDLIKKHSIYGYEMLEDIHEIDPEIKNAVLLHHERGDGSGYPLKANHDRVSIYAKIVAVADVYDAMTSDRVYKKGVTPFEAFDMFKGVGFGIFDYDVVNVFLKNIANHYTGLKVLLNNGQEGEIAFVPPQNIMKPIILCDSKYIDLSQTPDLKVKAIV